MNSRTDQQLLRDYAERRSEAAFAELVRRHVNLVYSAALRMVCDSHLAEDVTQGVFVALARSANQFRDRTVLSGWLHRTAQNIAAQSVRTDVRRRAREQEAVVMNELLAAEPAEVWEHIAPHLDAALGELDGPDRDALLLRYFEQKSAREMAQILSTSEDAAQKRVSRAASRLRDLLAKRGLAVGASGLVVVISANAVQAAPVGLAVTIAAVIPALAGTTSATLATTTSAKAIAMTMLQKTFVAGALAVLAGTGIYQARQASRLKNELQSLQQQQAPLTGQNQQLLKERDDATIQLAALRDDNECLNRNTTELLKLRGEVSSLRRSQVATPGTSGSPQSASETPASREPSPEDIGRELGMAVVRGERGALQKISDLAKAEHESFKTNSIGTNDQARGDLARQTFAPLRAAFDVIADAATQGNRAALEALGQATQIPELTGPAVQALGTLAGHGNNAALEILLDPDKYHFLLSSTVAALGPAAANGNQKAIEALASVAKDEKQQPLWFMAATSLSKAAETGNPLAVDTLIALAGSTNGNVQQAAIVGLQKAAANQNAKAAEALRAVAGQ